jgi:MFS family permease
LFNVGFAMIVSFGPSMLVEHGWSIAEAGSTISIVLWISVFSVPLGGLLADRTGRPGTIIVASLIVSAVLMVLLPRSGAVVSIVVALGLTSGLPAGPIMSLPARVLAPQTRAIGMGVFFTMFFGCMMLGPVVGGALAKWAGSTAAAFDFGAAMILLCPVLLWGFYRIVAGVVKAA